MVVREIDHALVFEFVPIRDGDLHLRLLSLAPPGLALEEQAGELQHAALIDLEGAVDRIVRDDGGEKCCGCVPPADEIPDGDIEASGDSGDRRVDVGEFAVEPRAAQVRLCREEIGRGLSQLALAGVEFLPGDCALFHEFVGGCEIALRKGLACHGLLLHRLRAGQRGIEDARIDAEH